MADQNINNMSVTWNSGGTTFAAEKMNVTDTASAAASLLQQWQVGGVNKWTVSKGGAFTSAGGGTIVGNSTITGTLGVSGAFTAAAISGTTGTFSGAVTMNAATNLLGPSGAGTEATLARQNTSSFMSLTGGPSRSDGGAILLYGSTGASPSAIRFLHNNTDSGSIDASGNWTINGTLTVTG